MSSPKLCFLLLGLIFFSRFGFADTLILKDGSKIEGEILDNQLDAIVIEYSVTPTIKDQKTVPRDSILKVVTASDEDKAYAALGNLSTPQNVFDTSYYDALVDKKIPGFIQKYPYTSHISQLRAQLRSLTAERDRVRHGDRRIDGNWITADQIKEDPYQMEAKMAFYKIKEAANNKDPVSVLKQYELLVTAYPSSRVMPDATDLALAQLGILQGQLTTAQANVDILDTNRQQAIAVAPADQAQQLRDAIDKDNQSATNAMTEAEKDGTRFFAVFPNTKDALDQLQNVITSEKSRFTTIQAVPMRESLNASSNASDLIALGSFKAAQDQIDLASNKWPANAEIASLRKKLQDAIKAASATPTPKP